MVKCLTQLCPYQLPQPGQQHLMVSAFHPPGRCQGVLCANLWEVAWEHQSPSSVVSGRGPPAGAARCCSIHFEVISWGAAPGPQK